METWRRTLVLQWSMLLALVVGLPWFRGGYLLTYDMVWVPDLEPTRADVWGLGSALPRAVPSDGVVAVLASVVDPVLLQRVVLLGALVLAGVGAGRAVRHLSVGARLAAATLAMWNPFVAERLVLGHWPLLVAYAALFWIVVGVREDRRAVTILALAATALTPVSGLIGVVALAVLSRGVVSALILGAFVNAPWITAAVLADARPPDPAGVAAFAIQGEGPLGRVGSVLALGGTWNTDVVPTSRTLTISTFIVLALWAVAVVGLLRMRRDDRRTLVSLTVLGGLGVVVATLGWWGSGWWEPGLLQRGIDVFGPFALLRDGTRWLALLAPLQVIGLAHGVDALRERAGAAWWHLAPAVLAVLLPLAALPDLANGVSGRVTPVDYPTEWTRAAQTVRAVDGPGDVLVLPFTAYRAPAWNEDRKVLDPAGRFFDRDTVTDDRLLVGRRWIAGEDPRAAQVRQLLRGRATRAELARAGFRLVVVDTSAPGGREALRQVRGLRTLDRDGDLRVLAVRGARDRPIEPLDRALVGGAWGLAGLVTLGALVAVVRGAVASRWTRRR